jgi:hypothetical protein
MYTTEYPVTEEGIKIKWETWGLMRERFYAMNTMDTALECGIFSEDIVESTFFLVARRADNHKISV